MNNPREKILMICMVFPPYFGGATFQAIALAKSLQKKGKCIEFITDHGCGSSCQDQYEGFRVHRIRTFLPEFHSKLRELLFSLRVLWFVFCHPHFTTLHFHSARGFELLLFPLYKALGRKVIYKVTLAENDDPLTFKRRRFLGPFYFGGLLFADRLVVISEKLKRLSIESKIPPEKIALIFNGVDGERFARVSPAKKKELRKNLGIPSEKFIFTSAGNIEARKGFDDLLEAYRRILDRYPDSELWIVGPGNNFENPFFLKLFNYLREERMGSVRFSGFRENLADYLKASDCFLFCSKQEGFGTVLIEAMACGIPAVAMEIPGITEDIMIHPNIGRMTPAGDPALFAQETLSFLDARDPEKMRTASEEIRSRFSIDRIAGCYVDLYESLSQNGPYEIASKPLTESCR